MSNAAAVFDALGDPTRRLIVDRLRPGPLPVGELAAGLPVVNTTLDTAVPRVARDGLEALTVAPGDTNALVSALQVLIADDELANKLGSAGFQRARAEYDQSRFLARVGEVYKEAVRQRRMSA